MYVCMFVHERANRKEENLRTMMERSQTTLRVFTSAVWCNISCARVQDPRTGSIFYYFLIHKKSDARVVRAGGT